MSVYGPEGPQYRGQDAGSRPTTARPCWYTIGFSCSSIRFFVLIETSNFFPKHA